MRAAAGGPHARRPPHPPTRAPPPSPPKHSVADVGYARYAAYLALYLTSVEFFVYWQHRLLHDIKQGYK